MNHDTRCYRRVAVLFILLLALFTLALSACSGEEPIVTEITRAPRTSAIPDSDASSHPTDPDTGNAPTTTAPLTPSTGGSESIEFPLELSKTPASYWQSGENPHYDEARNGFICYFTSDYTYSFASDNLCTLEITSADGKTETTSAKIDLSLGSHGFMEEGIFIGVGFTTDYVFEDGASYKIKVSIKTLSYTYVFSFDKKF